MDENEHQHGEFGGRDFGRDNDNDDEFDNDNDIESVSSDDQSATSGSSDGPDDDTVERLDIVCHRLSQNDPTLTEIRFPGKRIGDQGAKRLSIELRKSSFVKKIFLDHNNITQLGAILIANSIQRTPSKIETLDLEGNPIGNAGAEAISELLQSATTTSNAYKSSKNGHKVPHITTLYVSSCNMSGKGVEAILKGMEYCKSLRVIGLSDVNFGQLCLRGGIASPDFESSTTFNNAHLTKLFLNSNGIQCHGAIMIASYIRKKNPTHLEELHLNNNDIDDQGMHSLAVAIRTCTALRILSLESNSFRSKGGIHIADSLTVNSSIEQLYMSNNYIGDNGCVAFGCMLPKNSTIQFISLSNCSISNLGCTALGSGLSLNRSMENLDVSDNIEISRDGIIAIATGLSLTTSIQTINLRHCNLGIDVVFFAQTLLTATATTLSAAVVSDHFFTLKKLELPLNQICVNGAISLGNCLHCFPNLEEVNLEQNNIGDLGTAAISSVLPRTKIKTLRINSNGIGVYGIQNLVYNLCSPTSSSSSNSSDLNIIQGVQQFQPQQNLEVLILSDNNLGDPGAVALGALFQQNQSLKVVDIRDCHIGDDGMKVINECLSSPLASSTSHDDGGGSSSTSGSSGVGEGRGESQEGNSTITRLHLDGNLVTMASVDSFVRMLKSNKGLKELTLNRNFENNIEEDDDDDEANDVEATTRGSNNNNVDPYDAYRKIHAQGLRYNYFIERMDCKTKYGDYYLKLNKAGRRLLLYKNIPATLWTYVLSRVMHSPTLIFYFIRENPSLFLNATSSSREKKASSFKSRSSSSRGKSHAMKSFSSLLLSPIYNSKAAKKRKLYG